VPWYEYSAAARGGRPSQPLVAVRLLHGSRQVQVVALIDSGADLSAMDASYAEVLGLDRAEAEESQVTTAGGTTARVLRWPNRQLELQFENDRFAFNGVFVEFPENSDPVNLLGRADFFQRYIVQFWDANEMMNIDASPDYPLPAP
jgi:hypothetical protein